ncbi:murein hydrolase activator EnvC family protein [Butyrivibrio sp. YAB3001]|uniref:murein hydrolase activator EnvC family protein n=1 Tax=Butyrivibrio sp. YAB3001 TaxID=1520812 RepID=UPI0008F62B1D|nr:peptidoglycan DD-metalloendopeptidase family protein [Butyrivibrio sp. YAB3001]SFC18531.1 Murein DD-endopeptidase MepM and murein hydrolase activator NlpD, contain LysM domain [Butyrivibrio sp. YAB3001]
MNRLFKWKKIIVYGILFVILLTFLNDRTVIVSKADVTEESIKAKENQISNAKKERDSLKSAKTDLEKVKKQLESSKSDLNNYISKIDASLTDVQEKIDNLTNQISEKEQQIDTTTRELEEAEFIQLNQYESMKKRIKFMYERGNTIYFELLIQSGSFADMLNKADYIEMLSSYDRQKLNEYIETTRLITLTKEALIEEKATLDEAKNQRESEQANLEALLKQKSDELSSVKADIKDKEAAIKEYEDEIKAENAAIAALEKEVEADKASLYSKYKYDGGMFTWPCPKYTRISDNYGMRMHPTLKVEKMHNGIDLAAPAGSAILAAYDGAVVAADYNGTMGNYIMINHGNGLYTVYMHCSALYVKKGQDVTAGTKIAAVGSTGRSTGNHLHFGVRLNGAYVSPWNYLK